VNAAALTARPPVARAPGRPSAGVGWLPRPATFAFCALALFAGVRFAALLAHPPVLRVLGVVVAAGAGGAALSYTRSLPRRYRLATTVRVLIVVLGAYLALRAAGVSPALLWPWRWSRLARELGRGLDGLDGLWPYDGRLAQARLAVMFVLPATIVPAATLAFWPAPGGAAMRRALALVVLLGVFVTAAMNEPQVGWRVQGILLLVLLCLWAWAWRPQVVDSTRAPAWMLVVAALALIGAGVVHSRTPLLDYRGWNPFGPTFPATSFNWNQTYGPLPWSTSNETMVSVDSRAPHLWRATTLDRFDGVGFVQSDGQPASTGALTAARLNPRWVTHATFTIRGLSSAQLLSPGQLIGTSVSGEPPPRLDHVTSDGTVAVAGAVPQSGERYTVSAYAPQPSASEMRAAPRSYPAAYVPYTEFELPVSSTSQSLTSSSSRAGVARIQASPYARVYALARRLAAGAASSYAVAARIEAFLHHGFTYDEHPKRSAYPLVSFLFSERIGYCQQFSGAMTLMLRMDGVPARVAAGFLPGARNRSTGLYEVSAQDAHAWVEVFFTGIGWVPFNPTPAHPIPGSSAPIAAGQSGPAATLRFRALALQTRHRARTGTASVVAGGGVDAGVAIAIALAGALALLLGLGLGKGAISAERAFADDAEGAVGELSRALARIGIPLAPGTTLVELERQLQRSHGPAASRYVRLLCARRYAPNVDARLPTVRDRRLMRRALCAHRGPLARVRALLALPPWTGRLRWRPASRRCR
jgi:protein-glutamine gamma-glutamyltransferase